MRRWFTAVVVALAVLVGGAVAFAQDEAPVPPAETGQDVDEPRFIGDPPGNEQTGEWEGEFEYEG
jgi:hypothetical protein